jgi:hypothetical protein
MHKAIQREWTHVGRRCCLFNELIGRQSNATIVIATRHTIALTIAASLEWLHESEQHFANDFVA